MSKRRVASLRCPHMKENEIARFNFDSIDTSCPLCGHEFNGAYLFAAPTPEALKDPPGAGDLCLCIECGEILEFIYIVPIVFLPTSGAAKQKLALRKFLAYEELDPELLMNMMKARNKVIWMRRVVS